MCHRREVHMCRDNEIWTVTCRRPKKLVRKCECSQLWRPPAQRRELVSRVRSRIRIRSIVLGKHRYLSVGENVAQSADQKSRESLDPTDGRSVIRHPDMDLHCRLRPNSNCFDNNISAIVRWKT